MNSSITLTRRAIGAILVAGLLLVGPGAVYATYPGSTDGRLAFGSTVEGNADIYTVLPNR